MIDYNKIILNILNYENPSNFEEIYKCLTLMKYKIDDSNIEKFDNILSLLVIEKKDIYPILDSNNNVSISKLEKTMNEISNGIIDVFYNDKILKNNKDNLSENQIKNITNKIRENISGTSYNYVRIKELLKILSDKIALPILEEYLLDSNINDSKKLTDVVEILKNNKGIFPSSNILEFLNIVLESGNDKSNILSVLYEFKDYINIDIIKKIPNIIVSIMDNSVYDKTFEIYKQHIELIKSDELCSNYVCDFLTIDVKYTNKIKRSFSLLKNNFKTVNKLTDFIVGYLEYTGNKDNNDEYFRTVSHYLANDGNVKNTYDEVLSKRELSDIELNKLDQLFFKFEIVLDIEKIDNNIYLLNIWKKYMIYKDIKNINKFLKECNQVNIISLCIKQLLSEKIKFNARVKKSDFYNTLLDVKNRFNNIDINNDIDELIKNSNLISKKDLVH